ncbi:hypothetical protein N7478_012754 [Penicillium angulare]|uniref:uncharacterized protein n=1 Tax=Penicillium angulare TaxID=116970 RepID=UPI0025417FD6|nr:uncharacterized protein N7478_012754 [Penicillium angulare]KAJ5256650.1 hypothetical protein N7478_012754 [Penicillium angulare]
MAASYPSPAILLKLLSGPTWSLTRNLRSTNKNEINGQLLGTATFTKLVASDEVQDWLYTESGQFPTSSALPPALAGMASATWSKKYIWRLSNAPSELSAWFVKVGSANEADYLFHKFDFGSDANISINSAEQYAAPVPILPEGIQSDQTRVLQARGDHLCINDMYRTSYAFRFHRDTNELLSWSSLHVVRGPAKSQEITNHYIPQ